MRSFAFVPPRYFPGIAGGAETLMANLALELSKRGDNITILTTCAKDNRTWENDLPEGESREEGLNVIRFKVDSRNLDKWIPLQIRLSEGFPLSVEDQFTWMTESVNSKALYDYIYRNETKYDAFFFGPYLFGTTFWGSLIHPHKSFLIPCLHDEVYAYTDLVGSMFRQVRGALFNAEPEMQLARRLYGNVKGFEVGMGFYPREEKSLKPYFEENFPYLIYVGRKETGKNVQVLIDYFIEYKNRNTQSNLKLVIVGGGSFSDLFRPEALLRDDIVDVPHVTEDEKVSLIKNSTALVQPSVNESFSIVLMEAWLQGVPVLVHGQCAVTHDHILKSSGGLFFSSSIDFSGVVDKLVKDEPLRKTMAKCGKEYTESYYNWQSVIKRFDNVVEPLLASEANYESGRKEN